MFVSISQVSVYVDMNKTVVSQTYVRQTTIPRLAREYVANVETIPDATQEIMLVQDKVHWHRLFWNPVNQMWQVSQHTRSGWTDVGQFATTDLVGLIDNTVSTGSEQYNALQLRSNAGIRCYLSEPLTVS